MGNRSVIGRLLAASFLVLAAAGCSDRSTEPVDEGILKRDAHTYFALYNSQGKPAPEIIPSLGKAPLGALMKWVRVAHGLLAPGQCTVTHVAPGIVMTAAHCVADVLEKETYISIVYYNKSGQLSSRRVAKAYLLGAPTQRDIAFLKLDSATSDWDSWDDDIDSFIASSVKLTGEGFSATVWSLDPLPLELLNREKGQMYGMKVMARTCTGTDRYPQLGNPPNNLIDTEQLVRANFLYFDDCTFPWIYGNSGALVTIETAREEDPGLVRVGEDGKPLPAIKHMNDVTRPQRPVAIASGIYSWPKSDPQGELEYVGPSGTRRVSRETLRAPLFAFAAAFDKRIFESKPNPLVTALRFDTP